MAENVYSEQFGPELAAEGLVEPMESIDMKYTQVKIK